MKYWVLLFLLIQICSVTYGEECSYIRVVSREDTKQAQAEKMQIRDALLPLIPENEGELEAALCAIESRANEITDCRVEILEWAPAGMASAPCLYITVGAGMGPNWWGILYRNGVSMFSQDIEREETKFVWPAFEWLAKWLGIG